MNEQSNTAKRVKSDPITLEEPIVRGEQTIDALVLRRPDSGSLRGVKLADILQIDVTSITVVLPRICEPHISSVEAARLSPADLLAVGSELAAFFLPKGALAEI